MKRIVYRVACEDCRQHRPTYLHRLAKPEREPNHTHTGMQAVVARSLCQECREKRQATALLLAVGMR